VDKVIALDTGSTDGTLDILRAAGADIIEIPFHDFGRSRTQLMYFARNKADWLLLLDADHTLRVKSEVPGVTSTLADLKVGLQIAPPEIQAYSLCHSGATRYWIPRLVRGDQDWRFVGATHEYLERGERATKLPGVFVDHHADGGSRHDKFVRDHRLLTAELEKEPENSRALFYLANTERDLGLVNSARELFLRRATLGGWDEEVFNARMEAAKISLDPFELWEVWASRPTRAEPLYWLERVYLGRGETEKAEYVRAIRVKIPTPSDVLFVDLRAYE
jgi:glycosyltransferase involved in cell wall biosynthesis